MEGDVVWSLKWTFNILENYYQNIQKIFGQFYENIYGWLYSAQWHGHLFIIAHIMFSKMKKYGISLNLDKCAFMVFSGMTLGFIISKEGKLPNPKKI